MSVTITSLCCIHTKLRADVLHDNSFEAMLQLSRTVVGFYCCGFLPMGSYQLAAVHFS